MKKIEIINSISSITDIVIPDAALKKVTDFLDDNKDYNLDRKGNGLGHIMRYLVNMIKKLTIFL